MQRACAASTGTLAGTCAAGGPWNKDWRCHMNHGDDDSSKKKVEYTLVAPLSTETNHHHVR